MLQLLLEKFIFWCSRRKLVQKSENAGKFVLIKGIKLYGTYSSREDARKAAYKKYNLKPPIYIQEIAPKDHVYHMGGFTRAGHTGLGSHFTR